MRVSSFLLSTALVTSLSLAACSPASQDSGNVSAEAPVITSGLETTPESQIGQISEARLLSPDARSEFRIFTDSGNLLYEVLRDNKAVIYPSRLGLRFADIEGLDKNIQILGIETASQDSTWEQPWGERKTIRDHHNEVLVKLARTDTGVPFQIRARMFDDGLGFRYELTKGAKLGNVSIMDELTEFSVGANNTAWSIPSRMYNRYEYLYRKTPVQALEEVHTPVTIKAEDGTHISIHEAALINYSGMSLEQEREGVLEAKLARRSDGVKVKTKTPFQTPWRTIQIADDASGLINSDLILNLNEPNKLGDVSWFTPGKYAGIWWEQHIKEGTWGNTSGAVNHHAATTEATMAKMDFAAANGFSGVLVEGWNVGWDGDWFNNGDVFSFTETYPDFDIEAVAAHGRKLGVRLIGHHETSGNITNYENQLEDALDLMQANGVGVIKSGYVADDGNIKRIDENGIARYEYHDSQHMVDHHLKVVKRAAEHRIAMNPHEPVKDTGLRRTYPNWVSREGARGQEFNAWGIPPNGPDHVLDLLYTRMLSGPMDYTAGAFDLRPNEKPVVGDDLQRNDKRSRIEHTLAKELSLYVAIYSPIQMVMDLEEHYAARPDVFQFIKDVPTDWERSIALQGEVGDFAVIVRKGRNSEDWYIGALTDATARKLSIDLDFLGGGNYEAQIYRDGPAADYESNPYDIIIETKSVTASDNLSLDLGRSGGAAIRLKKL